MWFRCTAYLLRIFFPSTKLLPACTPYNNMVMYTDFGMKAALVSPRLHSSLLCSAFVQGQGCVWQEPCGRRKQALERTDVTGSVTDTKIKVSVSTNPPHPLYNLSGTKLHQLNSLLRAVVTLTGSRKSAFYGNVLAEMFWFSAFSLFLANSITKIQKWYH